ncbi:MAG: hypothetical protein KC420_01165 [Myxococcales bacterium]|nr:hypothetical protein [Myxococcales bacterium]MCB9568997.1 hypothetical protein [Myxococcales bacterium]MCB9701051.1 hypothetical protein [Myxococcales bacterium]
MSEGAGPVEVDNDIIDRHLRAGWWALLIYLVLGFGLEALNGFKVGWYLDVDNETRRSMFRLAHAHGALLGLCNLALASTLGSGRVVVGRVGLASACLLAATVLLPGGFLLGGLVIYDGDPGLGIALVPIGALLLVIGVGLVAVATLRRARG